MKKYISIIILFFVSLIINAQDDKTSNIDSKNKKQSIVAALVNKKWNGTGVLMGKEATFTMDWKNVLDNKFIKLEFQNKQKSETNEDIVLRAIAFYKIVNNTTVTGSWFDNRGMILPLKGHVKENELTILWGNSETETGKTIYRYTSNSILTVEDFVMNNGEYYKFGNATYKAKD